MLIDDIERRMEFIHRVGKIRFGVISPKQKPVISRKTRLGLARGKVRYHEDLMAEDSEVDSLFLLSSIYPTSS